MAGKRVIPIAAATKAATAKAAPVPASEEGWRALSTLSEPRLSEMAQNYRALGYEVEIREVHKSGQGSQGSQGSERTEGAGGCTTCFDAGERQGFTYGTLYVRRPAGGTAASGDPFE